MTEAKPANGGNLAEAEAEDQAPAKSDAATNNDEEGQAESKPAEVPESDHDTNPDTNRTAEGQGVEGAAGADDEGEHMVEEGDEDTVIY